jgi:sugar O-acyltransferase (sialic acid O-acetyltransferase NeuD family)
MYCIYGAGGHATDIVAQLSSDAPESVLALVDDFAPDREVAGISVVTFETAVSRHPHAEWLVAIGTSADRRRVSQILADRGLREGRLISPRAFVAKDAVIAPGAQIFAGCCISSNVRLDRGVIVNFNSTLSHDISVGDHATISPGCSIAGRVEIGAGAFVGVGATIINGTPGSRLLIGAQATVGAGAVVIRNVDDGDVVAGVPARSISRT